MNHNRPTNNLAVENRDDRVAEFLELYSTNYPRLQFYVTALLPTANDASDVLQETSMVLWRKFDTFELGTQFLCLGLQDRATSSDEVPRATRSRRPAFRDQLAGETRGRGRR